MSTTRRTPVETLAVLAIVQHAADHGLGLNEVETPHGLGLLVPRVRVTSTELLRWMDTVEQMDDPTVTHPMVGWETSAYPVRIVTAIGDLVFEVVTTRKATVALTVVGAAS